MKRWSKMLALAFCLAGSAMVPTAAKATSFAELTLEQFTDASTYVVRGKVLDVWTELDDAGLVWTKAKLQVNRTLKGPDSPQELTVTSLGGRYGAHQIYVPGMPGWSEGEKVLVFLAEGRAGRLTPISMFQGKMTVRRAPGETRHHVVQYEGRANNQYDHRFLPHPKPEDRVYVDDIIARVEARLQTGWDGKPIPGVTIEKLERINKGVRR